MDNQDVQAAAQTTYPELTIEQKLSIRDAQIVFAAAKEDGATELQATQKRINENIQAKHDALVTVINNIGLAHGIKDAKSFDLAQLKFN